jgi:TonB-dependent receptor
MDLTLPLGMANLKAGFLADFRERDYGIQAWATDASTVRSPNYNLWIEPLETVFQPDNYGERKFRFIPITVFTGTYSGQHRLNAFYTMLDLPFLASVTGSSREHNFRLVGGARLENSDITVDTVEAVDDPVPLTTRLDKTDILPSLNFTYLASDNMNLRLGYSQSINRPEFREMANVLYYDFDRTQNVLGNPDLNRALVFNYDVRFEVFPSLGEVLAVSYFYKDLKDAIEERLIPSPERFTRTWFNSPNGKNHGFEIEVRKSLGTLSNLLSNFSISGNYTHVESEIEYNEERTDAQGAHIVTKATRVMQGQSPWTINLSLLFAAESTGTSINFLYNKIGRRLHAVGDQRIDDVYEEAQDLVDLALTQKWHDRWQIKLAAKNLLGKDETYTSGPERAIHRKTKRGTAYSLSLSFDL